MPRRALPIRQLPSGRWQARPAGIDPATFDDYDDAEAWCLEQLVSRSRGTVAAPGTARITFAVYAEEWQAAQPWSRGTRSRIQVNLRCHLYPAIGDVPIVRLRPTRLQAVLTALSESLAPATVMLVYQHLNQVLNGAVADGIRPDNPAHRLRLPRRDDSPLIIPTVEQVLGLAGEIDPRSRALVAVGAGLGLRQAEAFALRLGSIDFLGRSVFVSAQILTSAKGRPELVDTVKTGMARRVPLPGWVATELAQHLERFDTDHPDGLAFTTAQGFTLRAERWNATRWKPAAAAVGLDAGYHSLRHFCSTSLLRRGVSVAAVAKVLGNSPATVLRYYAHHIADDAEVVRSVLDRVLDTPGNEANTAPPAGRSGTVVARNGAMGDRTAGQDGAG